MRTGGQSNTNHAPHTHTHTHSHTATATGSQPLAPDARLVLDAGDDVAQVLEPTADHVALACTRGATSTGVRRQKSARSGTIGLLSVRSKPISRRDITPAMFSTTATTPGTFECACATEIKVCRESRRSAKEPQKSELTWLMASAIMSMHSFSLILPSLRRARAHMVSNAETVTQLREGSSGR